jgi:predicted acetyltransferase
MLQVETRISEEPSDLEALAAIEAWAFGTTAGGSLAWLKNAGPGSVRVACMGGVVRGGLIEVPMGQWFGGKSVPMLGIAGVAIAAEERGRGLALELLRAALRSARARGLVLSTLYPATYGLYRKAGYELAGSLCRVTLQLRQLARGKRPLHIQSLAEGDRAEAEALYREVSRHRPGHLDRGPYVWDRVRRPNLEAARALGAMGPHGLQGYVYARTSARPNQPFDLVLSDFVSTGPAAYQTLLAFLADHSTTAERVTWYGGLADARLFGLPQRVAQVAVEDYWMLRLVDVKGALLGRGYPNVDLAVELSVEDAFLPENSGQYSLSVRGGVPALEEARGSSLRAHLSVGALAALYSGFLSPRELQSAGQLDADEPSQRALALLFGASPAPALADYF